MDASPLGVLCAQVMEQIEERYGADAIIRTAAVVVEIDSKACTEILVAANDDRPWVQMAFLDEGQESIRQLIFDLEREEEE